MVESYKIENKEKLSNLKQKAEKLSIEEVKDFVEKIDNHYVREINVDNFKQVQIIKIMMEITSFIEKKSSILKKDMDEVKKIIIKLENAIEIAGEIKTLVPENDKKNEHEMANKTLKGIKDLIILKFYFEIQSI